MVDAGRRKTVVDESLHASPRNVRGLAASRQDVMPEIAHDEAIAIQGLPVGGHSVVSYVPLHDCL